MGTPNGSADTYYIKPGYKARKIIHTRDEENGGNYWNGFRIRESSVYQLPVYDLTEDLISQYNPRTVADVGCGVGTKIAAIAHRYPGIEFYGYDQTSSIQYCKSTHKVGTWTAVDLDDESVKPVCRVDMVICSDVVEHLEHPEKLLEFIRRTLNDDGVLIISTPERDLLRGKQNMESPKKEHVREWNRAEFSRFLEHSGFETIDWKRQFNVRPSLNAFFVREFWGQLKRLRSPKYNQVFIAKLAGQ